MESRAEKALDFFLKRLKVIVIVLILLGVCAAVVYSYFSYKEQLEMSAAAELYQYEKKYQDYLNGEGESEWLSSLGDVQALGESYSNVGSQRALYMAAVTYFQEKEYEKALELFEEILRKGNGKSLYSDFSVFFLVKIKEEKDRAEAIKDLDQFIRERKKSFLYPKAVLALGKNYVLVKDFKKAKETLLSNMQQLNSNDQREARRILAYISVNEQQ